MYFQHLQAKKVKLNDLATMQHYLITQESWSDMNQSIEDLNPAKLSNRVKARIAQLHLKRRPRSDDKTQINCFEKYLELCNIRRLRSGR